MVFLWKLQDKIINLTRSQTFINGSLFTFFAFVNNGISFFLLLILARYIPPDQYGQLNLFNTFIQLFNIIICLGTTGYISVSFFKKNREELRRTINSVLIIASGVLLLLSTILFFIAPFCEKIIGIDVKYQWIALFICYFQIFNNINIDIWRLEEKTIKYGIYSISLAVFNFIITLVLVISYQQGWLGRLYAQAVVAVCFFIISLIFLFKRKYIALKWPEKKLYTETLKFGVPLIPHQASSWIKMGLDRYIIYHFLTVGIVGLYSFATNFASIITIVGVSFNATNSVYIYKKLANGYLNNKTKLDKQTKFMSIFFLLLTLSIMSAYFFIVPIFLPKYTESVHYVIPLCLSALFGCYYLLYVNYLFFYCKTKQLMYITFSAAILQMIFSLLLTKHGAIWTAYINMFTSFLTFILVYTYSKKVLNNITIDENYNQEIH